MAAIIKNRFRIQNAKDFIENLVGHPRPAPVGNVINISEGTEAEALDTLEALTGSHVRDRNLYLFVGRPRPWPNLPLNNPPVSEIAPPFPLDTVESEARIWQDMLGLKKTTRTFSSLVVPRFNWDASGDTIYIQYDDKDSNMFNHPTNAEITAANLGGYVAGSMYIITDEYHVFKCLSNNNNSKSTDKPQKPLTSPYIFESSTDGYRWKYLTTITPDQVVKFLTDRWIPVVKLTEDNGSTQWLVQQAAVDGAIESFSIDNRGSGYQYVHSGGLVSAAGNQAVLDGSPAPAPFGINVEISMDGVYNGSQIHITSGPAAGTIRDISSYIASTQTITLDGGAWVIPPLAGDTYEIVPKIVISGSGTGAIAKPIVETDVGPDQFKLKKIVIIAGGTGYRYATASITGGGGSGALARPVLSQVGGHGADIEQELGAFFVMINTRLEYNEGVGDFPISNDYRQVGIIRDLKNFDGSLATEDTRIATKKMTLENVTVGLGGSFGPDETITGVVGPDVATAKVIDFVSTGLTTGTISFIQDETTGFSPFLDGMTVTGLTSSATGDIVVSGITDEEIKKFSGEILYIEHRRPILRAPDQIEDLKAIVEF